MDWKFWKTDKEKLVAATVTTETRKVANKQPFYHEIVPTSDGAVVRIYSRKEGLVEERKVVQDKHKEALALLSQYNGGA